MIDSTATPPAAQKKINPNVPTAFDMTSTPIGPIPCACEGDEVLRFPDYFDELKKAAGITYKNQQWSIVSDGGAGIVRHNRFCVLIDAAKVLLEKWLYANGYPETSSKLSGVNREDLLKICMGKQTQARITINGAVIVATTGKITELHGLTTSGIEEWLMMNSSIPKYTDKKPYDLPF